MKTVTSATVFQDAVGMRLSMTYSEIDDKGMVIADNKRLDRVITDTTAKKAANTLLNYGQDIVDGLED